ncbi:glycosyltransferase [Marinitoga piezophila KA3]|uniref:Glycosyltransferase n=1 Tax=Marinitoga piezophila (strain DSM 14283 / JCM 11233 / KA3) TaxID=443254 RepID=H2J4U1_MARPK|nr:MULTISPECIES: glycosyltransferase [Marinitoga]AEX84876.1 glycosyltransferase [Marinitoga piezophila KA3]APT75380.1 glycosyl transferase family 1 [Marinitoga sp. 1137]
MKILLFSEGKNMFQRSGVGKALQLQQEALKLAGVDYTLNPEDNYDIVHINTIGFTSEKILKEAKKKGKKIIVHTHTTYEDFRNSFIFSNQLAFFIKKRLIKMYSNADFLISPTKYTQNLVRSYGIKTKSAVVSNGVDTNKFKYNAKSAIKFKEKYKLNKPLILSVGLPFERKGILDFYKLAKKLPQFQFIWLGAKMKIVPKKIRKILNEKSIKNLLFPGYIPTEDLINAYSAADIFLFPSYEENEGIVVLEALSSQTPLIIRDIPVYKDWLTNEVNCLKSSSLEDFEKNIFKIINKEIDVEKLKENERIVALERDLKVIGEKLKNIYGDLYAEKV